MDCSPSLLSRALEILFPRCCVLCGRGLLEEADRAYPLCGECEEDLPRIRGERCPICGKPLVSERGLCMRCRDRSFAFDSAYPLWEYSGKIKDLLISYKIRGVRPLARFLASRVYDRLREGYPGTVLVPVPFRKGKIRKTGWDQVEDLARSLERRGVPVMRCLERAEGASQKTLDYSARMSNLTGKIRVRKGAKAPERVVLLDDVLTTGATLSECARVLKAAGTRRVDALVLAAD